jgi:hypothetical protein
LPWFILLRGPTIDLSEQGNQSFASGVPVTAERGLHYSSADSERASEGKGVENGLFFRPALIHQRESGEVAAGMIWIGLCCWCSASGQRPKPVVQLLFAA